MSFSMDLMANMQIVKKLADPHLVTNIQNYFGIKEFNKQKIVTVENSNNEKNPETRKYIIENKFWYYLFYLGTFLGDEIFYTCFFPFWFWNIDGAVGRRVVLVWTIIMYVGQGIKDIIKWPRPAYPVFQLQEKWALEYGFPSTHAMVGVSIPFSIFLYTINRYQYNASLGFAAALLWCTIISISRLYLGMHNVLDIIGGLILAIVLMFPLVPVIDYLDNIIITSPTSPFLLLTCSLLMIVYYPNSGKWTPTRGDTTMIISVCFGILTGAWLNYQTGLMTSVKFSIPHMIMWPSCTMLIYLLLRTIIGFLFILLTRQLFKSFSYTFVCVILKQNEQILKQSENTLENKCKIIVELSCKFITCAMIGLNISYLLPQLFRFFKIERPTFFTEI